MKHLGQLHRPANICQDLAQLGSRHRVLVGSRSDAVFLSVSKTSPVSSHTRTPHARTGTPALTLACRVISDKSPHFSVTLSVIHKTGTAAPTLSLCSQPASVSAPGPVSPLVTSCWGWIQILESTSPPLCIYNVTSLVLRKDERYDIRKDRGGAHKISKNRKGEALPNSVTSVCCT